MADISIKKDHSVDPGVLRGRLEELAAELKAKYGVRCRWEGSRCVVEGSGIKQGFVDMTPTTISLELTLGTMAKLFKPRIEQEIGKKIGKLVAP